MPPPPPHCQRTRWGAPEGEGAERRGERGGFGYMHVCVSCSTVNDQTKKTKVTRSLLFHTCTCLHGIAIRYKFTCTSGRMFWSALSGVTSLFTLSCSDVLLA
jgi:hypothetical protein